VVLGFNLKVLYLVGRCSTTWAMHPACFVSVILGGDRVLCFCPLAGFLQQSSYLYFLCSWDYWHIPPCPSCWLRWESNFLPWLPCNCNPPDLHHHSGWNYRCEPLCLASPSFNNLYLFCYSLLNFSQSDFYSHYFSHYCFKIFLFTKFKGSFLRNFLTLRSCPSSPNPLVSMKLY
jgi:hypothetical protein